MTASRAAIPSGSRTSSPVMASVPPFVPLAPVSVASVSGPTVVVVATGAVVVVVVVGGGVVVKALVNAQVTWGSAAVRVTRTSEFVGSLDVPLQVIDCGAQVPASVSSGPDSTTEYCPRSSESRG